MHKKLLLGVEVVVSEFLRGGTVGIFIDRLEGAIGLDDFLQVLVGEHILVLRILEVTGGVDEEYVAMGPSLLKEQDGGGDAGAEEQIGG